MNTLNIEIITKSCPDATLRIDWGQAIIASFLIGILACLALYITSQLYEKIRNS